MTCIAWDGKTLAADKRTVNNGLHRTVTKIYETGELVAAVSGSADHMSALFNWLNRRDAAEWPKFQDGDDWSLLVVVMKSDRSVLLYERTPHPWKVEDRHFSCGSGRDFAMAALHLGKTAREAVEVACVFDVHCGNGVDSVEV
jgi:ATP-dependent protease HslVU (ClpYQ) peptidase subunit